MNKSLHTINKSPNQLALWDQCMSAILPEDTLVLIENAVLVVTQPALLNKVKASGCKLAALECDLTARGLTHLTPDDLTLVNMEQFVSLTCQHDKVISWF